MKRWLALLLLWPAFALADPISAVAFLAPIIGGTAAAFIVSNAVLIFYAGVTAYGLNRRRSAKQKAAAAYNAGLKDRLQMADLQPDQARTIVLGRARTVEGIRRRWSSGANSENLTLIISFAGHEIDAWSEFYFNDLAVEYDGSGYVTTAPYGRSAPETKTSNVTLNGSGGGSFTIASTPVSGSVSAVYSTGSGIDLEETLLTVVSVVGTSVTLSGGPPDGAARIMWQTIVTTRFARIRTYNGTAGQNVGADLDAEYPGLITSTDEFAGIAVAVVDLTYDPDIFPTGLPNITARIRGAKVYDPREDSTVDGGSGSHRADDPDTWEWSENPALHALYYAMSANGWAVPVDEIRIADVMAAADVCDVSTTFTMRLPDDSTEDVTMPRYRSGIVIPTDADPKAMMDEIIESMAGRQGWAGGIWRMRAGAMATPVWAMDSSWIAQRLDAEGNATGGAVVRISNGVPRDAKVNRVAGTCVDRMQRYQVLPFPAVEDPVLIAAEGEYAIEVEYQAVNHVAHAQHLASIAIRESQAALRMETTCNLSAYRCEMFDVGEVTIDRYGMEDKTFEVTGWRWHPADGVQLNLAEITDAIFEPDAELGGRDPAPDSSLPAPWDVETITGVSVDSGTTALTDGSVLTRTRVEWSAALSQAIRRGGSIEVQYTPAAKTLPAGDWPSWTEQGDSTEAIIPGLVSRVWVFRVRAVNSLRVRGKWSAQAVHYVAQPRRPLIFRQNSAPSGSTCQEGDIWFDTNDDNQQYVRASGAWVSVRDTSIAAALAAANDAQATADGKIATFFQNGEPLDAVSSVGDIWFDTNDAYKQYRYDGADWVLAADTRIGDAINDAADAQATADGKVVTFIQDSAPTAEGVGDLWIETDRDNRLRRWDGSTWVVSELGTEGLAPDAATEVYKDKYDFAGAIFGTGTARTFTVTPAVDCVVEFSAKVTAGNVLGDSGNRFGWYAKRSGEADEFLGGSETNDTAKQEFTAIDSFNAAAGVAIDFDIDIMRPSGNPAIQLYASYLRVTLIKR